MTDTYRVSTPARPDPGPMPTNMASLLSELMPEVDLYWAAEEWLYAWQTAYEAMTYLDPDSRPNVKWCAAAVGNIVTLKGDERFTNLCTLRDRYPVEAEAFHRMMCEEVREHAPELLPDGSWGYDSFPLDSFTHAFIRACRTPAIFARLFPGIA